MINNITNCKDCVKSDVCSIKQEYNDYISVVSSFKINPYEATKDNKDIIHDIKCNKFFNYSISKSAPTNTDVVKRMLNYEI